MRRFFFGLESLAVVFDDQHCTIGHFFEQHRHAIRARVFRDVVKCLLRYPVKVSLRFTIEQII
jgi:hypothetical protein